MSEKPNFYLNFSELQPNFINEIDKGTKKLLEAVEKEIIRKPDRKALDRLSLFVGFQDWESFQEALHGETSADENYK